MPRKVISVQDFWSMFSVGRMYLIKRVFGDKVVMVRLFRRSNNMWESPIRTRIKIGLPDTRGVIAEPGDLAFKGTRKKYKLLKRIVNLNPPKLPRDKNWDR